jgi:hypothetical protein
MVPSTDSDQYRFGKGGKLTTETREEEKNKEYTDFGETRGPFDTKGGYNRFEVSSLLQKAVRRSAEEEAAWAAWELARSGFTDNLWDRLNIYVIEDLAAGENAALLIARFEQLANERWSPTSWEGRLCAIHAALTAARARSSREATEADAYFRAVVTEQLRAKEEDREPTATFLPGDLEPARTYDVVFDQHTRRGKLKNRGDEHFAIHASRVGPSGETDLGAMWKRYCMLLNDIKYTEEQIEHSVSPVPTADPWQEPNLVHHPLDSYE